MLIVSVAFCHKNLVGAGPHKKNFSPENLFVRAPNFFLAPHTHACNSQFRQSTGTRARKVLGPSNKILKLSRPLSSLRGVDVKILAD